MFELHKDAVRSYDVRKENAYKIKSGGNYEFVKSVKA